MISKRKFSSIRHKKISIGLLSLIFLLLIVFSIYIIKEKKQITDILCPTLVNVSGSVTEIAGAQPVYMCKNYFISQDDLEGKYFVSKVAEGLLLERWKQLVTNVQAKITWKGKVRRISVDAPTHVTRCVDTQPNEKCKNIDEIIDHVNLIQILNVENEKYDFPFFKIESEMANILFEIKKPDSGLFESISFKEIPNYIHIGDVITIEQDLTYINKSYSNIYRITVQKSE